MRRHTRPSTPDFLELRSGAHATAILPGGLPFHQRQGTRMLDIILVPEGESANTFDLALGLELYAAHGGLVQFLAQKPAHAEIGVHMDGELLLAGVPARSPIPGNTQPYA